MAVMDYRTRDGLVNYCFSVEFQSDIGWRVYIVFQPLYQDNHDNSEFPDQATDCNGRSYVNWPTKLDSLGDAKTVAELWAENTEHHARELVRSSNDETNNPTSINRPRPKAA